MRVLVDCDGVLADTMSKVLELYNREYGVGFTLDDITEYCLENVQADGTDMGKYFNMPGFFRGLEVVEGACEGVERLKRLGFDVKVVTASPIFAVMDKYLWLRENFRALYDEDINFIVGDGVRNIEVFKRRNPEVAQCGFYSSKRDITGDVILDDCADNLAESLCECKVLYDRPWNRGDRGFKRVYGWGGFYYFVTGVR